MKLVLRYQRRNIPVEVCLEAPGLEPGRACELFQYIVARLDAAVNEALLKMRGGRGVQPLEADTPRPTAPTPTTPDSRGEP